MKLDNDMWKQRVGLLANEQLTQDYIDLGHGEFVRRASIRADLDESAVRAIAAKISFSPSLSSLHEQMIAAPPWLVEDRAQRRVIRVCSPTGSRNHYHGH
jgi:hypothetical protein